MGFSIVMCLTVLITVSFFVTEKRMHLYEYIFCYLLFQFVFVTGIDVLNPKNSEYLQITKEPNLFWTLRLAEIFLTPLLVLFYLEGMNAWRSFFAKLMLTLLSVLVLFGVESTVVVLQAIRYDQWQPWWSFPAWFAILMAMYGSQRLFRRLLRWEGVAI